MMPPTSIDGTDITGATIDGTDVTEITVDGQTVFSAGPDVPNDTIAYWPGDEGTGTTLTDKVGTADLTINGPTWVSNPDFKGGFGLDFGSSPDHSNSVTGTAPTPAEFSWFIRVNLDELVNVQPGIRGIIDYQVGGRGDSPLLQYIFANAGNAFRFLTSSGELRLDVPPSGTVTVVCRYDSSSRDLDVFDDTGSSFGNTTSSGGTQSYQSSTVELGQVLDARDWQGTMDPNWMLLDKRVSDTEMNSIINQYYS